jgi:hypothetical protein
MSLWEEIMNHASLMRLGSDALVLASAISSENATMFAGSLVALVKDVASETKIKEIPPAAMDALQPHIEGMTAILMAVANGTFSPAPYETHDTLQHNAPSWMIGA